MKRNGVLSWFGGGPVSWLGWKSTIGLLRGLLLSLAVVAATWVAAPTISSASPGDFDWEFSNASAILNGTPVSITGTFTTDGFVGFLVNIQVTGGSYTAAYQERCIFGCPGSASTDTIFVGNLSIRFANAFVDAPGPDPLASVEINGGTDTAPTGVADVIGTEIGYEFANASAVVNGVTESISGHFGFDPLSLLECCGTMINLAGPSHTEECFFDSAIAPTANEIVADCPGAFPSLTHFTFANNLSATAADPLVAINYGGFAPGDATGFAVPFGVPVPTPEPTSLALLGAALGLFLLHPRITAGRRSRPGRS
jgi:hypothetical protein